MFNRYYVVRSPSHSLTALLGGLLTFLFLTLPVQSGLADITSSATNELTEEWMALRQHTDDLSENQKLGKANNFFNDNIRFTSDLETWNVKDYWATPLETLTHRQGDCEDFSIAKYITLIHMGISASKLRLVYVKAILQNGQTQAHMVLAYYPSLHAEPLILDNLNLNILPASKRSDLVPIYSFNSEGLWIGQDRDPKIKQAESRLSNWRDVTLRMKAEGIYD